MKCVGCPDNCLGTTTEFAYFCDWWASGDPDRRRHVVNRSRIVDGAPALPLKPPSMASFTPADPETLRAAETCPHRMIPECGCSGMECGPGGRRAGSLVTIRDCLACVSG